MAALHVHVLQSINPQLC